MVLQYTTDPSAVTAAYMSSIIIFAVVWLIIDILLLIWVYKDAKKRDMNAVVWVIFVFFCGCCACIIYLIVRKKK